MARRRGERGEQSLRMFQDPAVVHRPKPPAPPYVDDPLLPILALRLFVLPSGNLIY